MICAACGSETAVTPCASCGQQPLLDERFALEAMLGQGSFGTTWRARDREGLLVALKEMLMRPELHEQVEREVRVLRQLRHPGVPRYVEAFRSRSGRYPSQVLVMELVEGHTLADELAARRFGALDVVEILQELAEILVYLHGLSPPVIHRDIKPANIMRRLDGSLVLIDFGLVRDTAIATLGGTREVGTLGYQAPEQFAGDPVPASDLYSLGAVAVRLLTRREPHQMVRALYEPMRWRRHANVTDAIAALIDDLVAPEPSLRLSSASAVVERCRGLRDDKNARQAIHQPQPGPATPAGEPPSGPPPRSESVSSIPAPRLAAPPRPSEHFRVGDQDLDLVRVDPSRFLMGSPAGQPGRHSDELAHPVDLTRPFLVARLPVTQAMFEAITGRSPSHLRGPYLPQVSVSWFDAVLFCNLLSEAAGLEPAYSQHVVEPARPGFWGIGAKPEHRIWRWNREATGIRLCTEAEWECAARAGSSQMWSGSRDPALVAWTLDNAQGMVQPVGGLAPNAWGLHDMSGNVWEWCWDWYHAYPQWPVLDPMGSERGTYRVIRGGCAQYHRDYARVARRGGRRPERSYFYVGLRVAMNG